MGAAAKVPFGRVCSPLPPIFMNERMFDRLETDAFHKTRTPGLTIWL